MPFRYIILTLCIITGCDLINNDECLSPDCQFPREFRFNLVDIDGNNLVHQDEPKIDFSAIKVIDNNGMIYKIYDTKITDEQNVLLTELDKNVLEYSIYVGPTLLDTFNVSYRITDEECCGTTHWIDTILLNELDTYIQDNTGATQIIVEQ